MKKIGFVPAPEKEILPKNSTEALAVSEREQLFEEYHNGLAQYDKLYLEVKKMIAEAEKTGTDEESKKLLAFTDKERDDLHKKLIEIARHLGKSEHDVIADIFRQRGALEEYGLPEFPILHGEETEFINAALDYKKLSVAAPHLPGSDFYEHTRKAEEEMQRFGKENPDSEYFKELERLKSSLAIIYQINPLFHLGETWETGGLTLAPKDFAIREKRAKALAEKFGLETFNKYDSDWHEAEMSIGGVIVPKERLAEIAAAIRNEPGLFRVGEEFYSDKEKIDAEKEFQKMINNIVKHLSPEDKKRYLAERKKLYGKE